MAHSKWLAVGLVIRKNRRQSICPAVFLLVKKTVSFFHKPGMPF
jgi:hypothetical protein